MRPLSQKDGKQQQDCQKGDIDQCKMPKICTFYPALLPHNKLVGNQARHGCDQRTQAAEIDAYQQGRQILCES